jgi:hypothetical protein
MEIYSAKVKNYSEQLNKINKKYNSISFLRLISILLFLGSLYFYLKASETIFLILAVFFFIGFVFLMQIHSKLLFKRKIKEALVKINE